MNTFYRLKWHRHHIEMGPRTLVMGIVNTTPDSFSDGGCFYSPKAAIAHGHKLACAGADILDIGGESTRPFSKPVPLQEELARVIPVIESLSSLISIPISIDTTKKEVARKAIDAGASIVNDISALRTDPEMAAFVAKAGVPLILMHMLGTTPQAMQANPSYRDVVTEIRAFLKAAIERAEKGGIERSMLIVDPGIGFGKTLAHNLTIIDRLEELLDLGLPLLVGPSRKAFIRKILKAKHCDDLNPRLPIVQTGTQAVVAASILKGAHIVRVHDVEQTLATVKIIDAVKSASKNVDVDSK